MKSQESVWDDEYKNNKDKWRKERLSIPKLLKNKRVLEIGVGNGKNIEEIIRQKPKQIVAIDISTNALESINQNKAQKIKLLREDIRKTSFDSESFDVIICYYVLNNLLESDRIKAVKEIHRLLSKRGVILFEDFLVGDFRQSEKGKTLENNTLLRNNGLIEHFFSEKELSILFSQFKKVKTKKSISNPIRTNSKAKRKTISLILNK